MVLIRKLLSVVVVLCLITVSTVPTLAIEQAETISVTISDGETNAEYDGIWQNGELFLNAGTFGEITRYTYYNSEEYYGYSLGEKIVLIDKHTAELSIPVLNHQGQQVSTLEHKGENYFAISELLPWLNVTCFVENGIIYVLPDALSIWEVIPEITYDDHMFNLYREYGDDFQDVVGLSAMVVFDGVVNLRWDKLIINSDGESLYDYKCFVETWVEMATDETLVSKSLDDGLEKFMSFNKGIDTVEEIFGIDENKLIEKGDQLLLDIGFDFEDLGKYYEMTELWTDLRATVSAVDIATKYINPLKTLVSYEIIAKSDLDYLAYLKYLEENIESTTTLKKSVEEANAKLEQENGAIYSALIDLGYTMSKDAIEKPLEECLDLFSDGLGTYLNAAKLFYSTVIPVTKGYEGMAKIGVVSTIEEYCWDLAQKLSYEEMTEEKLKWMRQSYITALKASKKCYQAMQDTMDVKVFGIWDVFGGEGVMDYQINKIEDVISKLALTVKTTENDSADSKEKQSDYIREETASLFASLWEEISPVELLGQPLSVAIELWGGVYTSDWYSGGRLLQFDNGGVVILNDTLTVRDDPISESEKIAYVMLFNGERIVGDIYANMTHSEIQQLAAKYVFEPEDPQIFASDFVETGYFTSDFTYGGVHFMYSWSSPDADPEHEPANYVLINMVEERATDTATGEWFSGLYYQDENTGEYDVFIYADVHENGTCDIRWIEPLEEEDSTGTFEYMMVENPEDVEDEFLHIYFDELEDQLYLRIDGRLIVMDRRQQDYCIICNCEVDYSKDICCPNCGMAFTGMKPDEFQETFDNETTISNW